MKKICFFLIAFLVVLTLVASSAMAGPTDTVLDHLNTAKKCSADRDFFCASTRPKAALNIINANPEIFKQLSLLENDIRNLYFAAKTHLLADCSEDALDQINKGDVQQAEYALRQIRAELEEMKYYLK